MTGDELASMLAEHEIQFGWAVFSAVRKGFRVHPSSVPYADGNPDYWHVAELKPQLDGALFEIACWDNCATILIGLPEKAAAAFMAKFTDARPLATVRG